MDSKTVAAQAHRTFRHSKKIANGFYKEGKDKVEDLQENLLMQKDKILRHVNEQPISSMFLAIGAGFLLAKIFRNKKD